MSLLDTLRGHAGEKPLHGLRAGFAPLLAQGEALRRAFGMVRDLIMFADRRLILVDRRGVNAKKVEYRSIPYRAIPIGLALGRNAGASDIMAVLAQNTGK